MKNDLVYLDDILESINQIELHTRNVTREQFENNVMMQDAVIRRLSIIGEATSRLSAEMKNQFPDIPWKDIVAMRNIIVHEYEGVKLDPVWDVAMKDLPELKKAVEKILASQQ